MDSSIQQSANPNHHSPRVGVVGPCAAGKSTLIVELRRLGYTAKHIAQEHSYVADMWQRITKPDLLIYLQVSYPLSMQRRRLNWTEADYTEQLHRLRHARQHADLVIDTDPLSPEQVLEKALIFIQGNPRRELTEPGIS